MGFSLRNGCSFCTQEICLKVITWIMLIPLFAAAGLLIPMIESLKEAKHSPERASAVEILYLTLVFLGLCLALPIYGSLTVLLYYGVYKKSESALLTYCIMSAVVLVMSCPIIIFVGAAHNTVILYSLILVAVYGCVVFYVYTYYWKLHKGKDEQPYTQNL